MVRHERRSDYRAIEFMRQGQLIQLID